MLNIKKRICLDAKSLEIFYKSSNLYLKKDLTLNFKNMLKILQTWIIYSNKETKANDIKVFTPIIAYF